MDQRIDLALLRQFAAVADELHFGRAAARLGIAQPPLSQRIRRLEELLGFPVFARTSRRVELTPAGAHLHQAVIRLTADLSREIDAAAAVARGEMGEVSVGYVMPGALALVPPLVRRFRAARPGVTLQLREMSSAPQAQALREGSLDVGFLSEPEAGDSLRRWRSWAQPLAALVGSEHSRAADRSVALRDLAQEPFVMFPRAQAPELHDLIGAACRAAGFTPRVVQEAQSWQMIAGLVGAGVGVAIVPASVRRLGVPGVKALRLQPPIQANRVAMCTRQGELPPAVQAFVDEAQKSAG
ncbi:MAG TPA: LysR family transcriptional regulator [Longimicrobium sp.]|nr:LysR family transcriptional regulator [Longimicrobium sp.]